MSRLFTILSEENFNMSELKRGDIIQFECFSTESNKLIYDGEKLIELDYCHHGDVIPWYLLMKHNNEFPFNYWGPNVYIRWMPENDDYGAFLQSTSRTDKNTYIMEDGNIRILVDINNNYIINSIERALIDGLFLTTESENILRLVMN